MLPSNAQRSVSAVSIVSTERTRWTTGFASANLNSGGPQLYIPLPVFEPIRAARFHAKERCYELPYRFSSSVAEGFGGTTH